MLDVLYFFLLKKLKWLFIFTWKYNDCTTKASVDVFQSNLSINALDDVKVFSHLEYAVANFTKILRAAFAPISCWQKITNPNCYQ